MTNRDYIIELQHQVTGLPTAWRIHPFPSPSALAAIERREEIRRLQEAFKGKDGKFDADAMTPDRRKEFSDLSGEFDQVSFKVMAMILTPDFELPDGVNKAEYLGECVGLYEVFDTVIAFFLSISASSTASPEGKDALSPELLSKMVTLRPSKTPQKV